MPVPLFASVMGSGAVSLAWRRAAITWDIPLWPAEAMLWLAVALFVLIGVAYAAKWVMHTQAAIAEVKNPMRIPFVPTTSVATLVVATALAPVAPAVATVLWWIGAVGHLVLMTLVVTVWFRRSDIVADMMTPAWVIPIVGNVVTPLATNTVGNAEFAWFSFGVGMIFWLGMLPLLFQRLLTSATALPMMMLPTISIMVAPPAVGYTSWTELTGNATDSVARVLYAAAVMFAVIVIAQIRELVKVPFAVPSVAYTFPSGALAAATIVMAGANSTTAYTVIAIFFLALATIVTLYVVIRLAIVAAKGGIFLPEK